MKHGSFTALRLVAACLLLAFAPVLSSYGDEVTSQLESVVLESFNGDSGVEWKLDASKFATKDDNDHYPKMAFVETWPVALFGYNRDGSKEVKSLGIHGRFDRRGYNWIDVYPSKGGNGDDKDEPIELTLKGRIHHIDMWVWGSNLDYYIEAYFRDYSGVVHNISLGNIGYTGWKNIRANIPTNIPQQKRVLPRYAGLKFVKFRIWTQPTEKIGDFYVYFNQFKVLTDTFESPYDGNQLADPDFVQEMWASGSN
jgi:hypothetical protein